MSDTLTSVAVSNAAATALNPTVVGPARTLLVENRGANAIYVSPEDDVTTDTGCKVDAGEWRSFPNVPLWAIAETAAQTGTGTDRTLVWTSDS